MNRFKVHGKSFEIRPLKGREWQFKFYFPLVALEKTEHAQTAAALKGRMSEAIAMISDEKLPELVGVLCAAQRADGKPRDSFIRKWTEWAEELPTEELRAIVEQQAAVEKGWQALKQLCDEMVGLR
jgi:hypothetical protein